MISATLEDLPFATEDKTGWSRIEASDPLPDAQSNGELWPKVSLVIPSYNQASFSGGHNPVSASPGLSQPGVRCHGWRKHGGRGKMGAGKMVEIHSL